MYSRSMALLLFGKQQLLLVRVVCGMYILQHASFWNERACFWLCFVFVCISNAFVCVMQAD